MAPGVPPTPEPSSPRLQVLLVDDDPDLLAGLKALLRRKFDIRTDVKPEAALARLREDRGVQVIVSDMRMPVMDGATFLARAREVLPEAVPLLLTGMADLESAIAAVNDGHIFRFLQKPCPTAVLVKAIEAAGEQYRLVLAERELLEQTVKGTVQTLIDVLAITNPVSFGRAMRIKRLASALARELGLSELWQLEVAAMLSQLGHLTLPPETAERVYGGAELTAAERAMVERAPLVTDQLLRNIPRLNVVRDMIARATGTPAADPTYPGAELARRGSELLAAAAKYDRLDARGLVPDAVIARMRAAGGYAPEALSALEVILGGTQPVEALAEVRVGGLQVGMEVAEDVRFATGVLCMARGQVVTEGVVERLRNLRPGAVREPLKVRVRTSILPS